MHLRATPVKGGGGGANYQLARKTHSDGTKTAVFFFAVVFFFRDRERFKSVSRFARNARVSRGDARARRLAPIDLERCSITRVCTI